jgi:hypothetical protein
MSNGFVPTELSDTVLRASRTASQRNRAAIPRVGLRRSRIDFGTVAPYRTLVPATRHDGFVLSWLVVDTEADRSAKTGSVDLADLGP